MSASNECACIARKISRSLTGIANSAGDYSALVIRTSASNVLPFNVWSARLSCKWVGFVSLASTLPLLTTNSLMKTSSCPVVIYLRLKKHIHQIIYRPQGCTQSLSSKNPSRSWIYHGWSIKTRFKMNSNRLRNQWIWCRVTRKITLWYNCDHRLEISRLSNSSRLRLRIKLNSNIVRYAIILQRAYAMKKWQTINPSFSASTVKNSFAMVASLLAVGVGRPSAPNAQSTLSLT